MGKGNGPDSYGSEPECAKKGGGMALAKTKAKCAKEGEDAKSPETGRCRRQNLIERGRYSCAHIDEQHA